MGIIYEMEEDWAVEARELSITIYLPRTYADSNPIEVDYEDLDNLEKAVKKAQEVRRDKNE